MRDRREETTEVIGPFSVYLSMLEAHLEVSEQGPLKDKDIILYFMGSGASHRVTVADLRRLVSFGQCTTADALPEVTEEMVTAGLKATERWGVAKFQRKPTGSVPPYMVFEVGEHPRTFIEDILCAALAVAQKEGKC